MFICPTKTHTCSIGTGGWTIYARIIIIVPEISLSNALSVSVAQKGRHARSKREWRRAFSSLRIIKAPSRAVCWWVDMELNHREIECSYLLVVGRWMDGRGTPQNGFSCLSSNAGIFIPCPCY